MLGNLRRNLGSGILAELLQQFAVNLAGLPLTPVPLVEHDGVFGHDPRDSVGRPGIEAEGSQSLLDFSDFIAPQLGWGRHRLDRCRLASRRRYCFRRPRHYGSSRNYTCGRRQR